MTRHLVVEGWEVTGFDLVEGSDPEARFLVGDLRDQDAVATAIRGQDVVCHVGAIGDVYLAGDQPALAASVNVTGSTHVAVAASTASARVVYASTWEVYGPPAYQPVDEDHPCRPDHPYSITKLAGERMILGAAAEVPVIALRLGTAYGRFMRPNSVFRRFIDRARRGEPITIQGDGSQGRQFTHVADIARAFSLACRSDAHRAVLNVVAPETLSIKELAELVVARFPTEVGFAEARPGDVTPALVSSERARLALGWEATLPFEEGLTELMDSIEEG